jgi:hypothetical protein
MVFIPANLFESADQPTNRQIETPLEPPTGPNLRSRASLVEFFLSPDEFRNKEQNHTVPVQFEMENV